MYEYSAVVRRIIDGDSIVVDVDMGRGIWVLKARHRLVGCNARALADPGGAEARANLLELIPEGTRVTLRSYKPYKYGGSDEAAEYMCDITAGPFLPPGVGSLVAHLIATGWAALWDGHGPAPQPPWPRPEEGGPLI